MKNKMKNVYHDYIQFPARLMSHPFDGFDEFKRYKKGKLSVALVYMFLFIMFRIIKISYESVIINDVNPLNLNSIKEIITVSMIVVLFAVGNWTVTTLMEGKGTFKEIFTMTGYALFPIVIIGIPAVFASNLLTMEEMAIYNLLIGFAYVATFYLLFIGILNIHEFGLFKTIGTIFLTILSMAVMVFFALLFFSLLQEIISFVKLLWQEINLRW